MRSAYVLLCIAFATLTDASAVSAETKPELEPFELVRSLQFVQDAIAQGNSAAFEAQRNLLGVIADRFAAFEPTVWQKPRNARAALLLSMSGGPPRVLKTL
ncbi:MAG: chemotaxis protein MotC, partial [Methyloligellaceae bacterium]